MTMTTATDRVLPLPSSGATAARRPGRAPSRLSRLPARDRRVPVTTLTGQLGWIEDETGEITLPVSPPGVIGGAILIASRRSAGLNDQDLARMIGVSLNTVHAWEQGVSALFCVRYDRLCQVADVLRRASARVGHDVGELVLAGQCDLLIAGILRGFEDYAEVPPIDDEVAGEAARELLRWALTGAVPDRYSPYAGPAPLLAAPDVILFEAAAQDLQAGSHGNLLASYGAALATLAA